MYYLIVLSNNLPERVPSKLLGYSQPLTLKFPSLIASKRKVTSFDWPQKYSKNQSSQIKSPPGLLPELSLSSLHAFAGRLHYYRPDFIHESPKVHSAVAFQAFMWFPSNSRRVSINSEHNPQPWYGLVEFSKVAVDISISRGENYALVVQQWQNKPKLGEAKDPYC